MMTYSTFSYKLRVLLISVTLFSCSLSKQSPIRQLEELTEDIRLHHQEYTTADWKKVYAKYEQISAEMEDYQYSKEETEKIGEMEGECVGYFMKSSVKSLEGLGSEIKGFFEGMGEVIKENED